MASKDRTGTDGCNNVNTVPFKDAEEAWFWFITAQEARKDGARFVAGQGLYPRPCEPIDILKILDRLYRNRRLLRDHLLVLRHYGRRHMAPDDRRSKEVRAFQLWHEALERMAVLFEEKGIIEKPRMPDENWVEHALLYENPQMSLGMAAE